MENTDFLNRLSKIESKISSLKIHKSIELGKLYDGTEINITINQYSKNYKLIMRFFNHLNISFNPSLPSFEEELFLSNEPLNPFSLQNIEKYTPKNFNLTFGLETNFQDLYILIEILGNFGLEKVFYSNEKDKSVFIGSHNEKKYKYLLSKEIEIDKILEMPFYYSTINVLCEYYNISEAYILDKVNRDLAEEESIDNFNRIDIDADRETFNALTDGQYGDYEDFSNNGGDYDALKDRMGL